jgi:hypothetical protein
MLHTYLKEKTAFRKNHIKMDGRSNWGEEIFYNKLWIYFLHGHPHLLCLYTLILSPLVWWENILIRQNINFSNLMIYENVTKNVYLYYILQVFFPFIINCFFYISVCRIRPFILYERRMCYGKSSSPSSS